MRTRKEDEGEGEGEVHSSVECSRCFRQLAPWGAFHVGLLGRPRIETASEKQRPKRGGSRAGARVERGQLVGLSWRPWPGRALSRQVSCAQPGMRPEVSGCERRGRRSAADGGKAGTTPDGGGGGGMAAGQGEQGGEVWGGKGSRGRPGDASRDDEDAADSAALSLAVPAGPLPAPRLT